MILTLKKPLKKSLDFRVNASPLTPALCLGGSRKALESLELATTAGKRRVQDLFDVSPQEADQLLIRNASPSLQQIGALMDEGTMTVEGDVGNWLALGMSGGRMTVHGSAGHYAASMMTGGSLTIAGNTADGLGGALPGRACGMSGGTVLVHGNVGDRLGDRMRGGLIAVKGAAGDYCAVGMIAGSIVVRKNIGRYVGFGMRRGSLFLSRRHIKSPPDFFTAPRYHEISFLPLFIKHLQTLDKDFKNLLITRYANRCLGDRSVPGLGEIFLI